MMIPTNELSYAAAFIIGLMGSTHCISMCGGYGMALGLTERTKKTIFTAFTFNGGRILCYALAGLLLGAVGDLLSNSFIQLKPIANVLRFISGLLLIAMALYISRLWMGLSYVEQYGQLLWKKIAPFTKKFIPIKSPAQGFYLGLLWGLLPCGMIYSALLWSSMSGNALQSALLMLCFGLGTFPSMLSMFFISNKISPFLKKKTVRFFMAGILIVFGVMTLFGSFTHNTHSPATTKTHHHNK